MTGWNEREKYLLARREQEVAEIQIQKRARATQQTPAAPRERTLLSAALAVIVACSIAIVTLHPGTALSRSTQVHHTPNNAYQIVGGLGGIGEQFPRNG